MSEPAAIGPKTPPVPPSGRRVGMARAIELVEWMRDHSAAYRDYHTENGRPIAASVFAEQVITYDGVARVLKSDLPKRRR